MHILVQSFLVTVLVLCLLCSECSFGAEELDIVQFKKDAIEGWQSIMDSYLGSQFTRDEKRTNSIVAPVKAISGTTRRNTLLQFATIDCLRIDGTLESKKPDPNGIINPKKFSLNDFASLPQRVSVTAFSRIHNESYVAAIDTTTGSTIGLLEQNKGNESDHAIRWGRRLAFPSIVFANESFLPTDLAWDVHSTQNDLSTDKYWVKRVFKGETDGIVEISLIQGNTNAEYSLSLDASRKWAIVASKSKEGNFAHESVYTYNSKNSFHPKSIICKTTSSNKEMSMESVEQIELSELIPSDIVRSQCYLSSFGLPEPNFESKRSNFSVVLFCVVIAMCVGVGFLWMRKKYAK